MCCHGMNVHWSIQLCLQSLSLAICSQSRDVPLKTAPGKQMKRKGCSSSSKINTTGNTHSHITHFRVSNQLQAHSCLKCFYIESTLVHNSIFAECSHDCCRPDKASGVCEAYGNVSEALSLLHAVYISLL